VSNYLRFSEYGLTDGRDSMAFFLSFFMSVWCRRENARRDKVALEQGTQELSAEQKLLERELADNVPWFRYTS
jgi:hypothetical protein